MPTIKTRFCPSPTGYIHIGNARTALFNALYAKKHGGIFLLRIEDTDKERSKQKYIDAICTDLAWLGLDWQGYSKDNSNFYQQSKRHNIYQKYLDTLHMQNKIYGCFCSVETLEKRRKIQLRMGQAPRYDGYCRKLKYYDLSKKHSLRFKVSKTSITTFDDVVKGRQIYKNNDIGDFIIKRSSGAEAFFFTNALDDVLMSITHVIRGEDHLSNTPRQMMILKALEHTPPKYAHIPLILAKDNKPLSKRSGSISIRNLRKMGYLPIAVLNYLARLGHRYEENKLLSLEALAHHFAFKRIAKAPAQFDKNHLHYFQRLALQALNNEAFWLYIEPFVAKIVPAKQKMRFVRIIRHNIDLAHEALSWANIIFSNAPLDDKADNTYDIEPIFCMCVLTSLEKNEDFKLLCRHLKEQTHLTGKALFMSLRKLLTTRISGPDLSELFTLMDKKILIKRVKYHCNLKKQ